MENKKIEIRTKVLNATSQLLSQLAIWLRGCNEMSFLDCNILLDFCIKFHCTAIQLQVSQWLVIIFRGTERKLLEK